MGGRWRCGHGERGERGEGERVVGLGERGGLSSPLSVSVYPATHAVRESMLAG